MRDNALYFPFICVPDSPWVTGMLLYWDELNSIVPFDHVSQRSREGEFMSQLIQNRLVSPIFPRQHIHQIPNFADSFFGYLRAVRRKIERHSAAVFAPSQRIPVHLEKLGEIGEQLVEMGLGERGEHDWYELDSWVANHFMTFLACALGQLESVNAAPVTDDPDCFGLITGDISFKEPSEPLVTARAAILSKILPIPQGGIDLPLIAEFKKNQGERLRNFRREIEKRCVFVAQTPVQDRQYALELAVAELSDERDAIAASMRTRWADIVAKPVYAVAGATISVAAAVFPPAAAAAPLMKVGAIMSITNALANALPNEPNFNEAITKPMAYAAGFKKRFA